VRSEKVAVPRYASFAVELHFQKEGWWRHDQ
jgi:hypothetical protein